MEPHQKNNGRDEEHAETQEGQQRIRKQGRHPAGIVRTFLAVGEFGKSELRNLSENNESANNRPDDEENCDDTRARVRGGIRSVRRG